MNTNTLTMPVPVEKRLSVFIFYTDFAAGVHAKMVADGLACLAGGDIESSLDFWKLDSIPSVGPLKDAIIREARQADVWILACSSPCDKDAMIMQWMNSLTARDAGGKAPALLVGLFANPIPCDVNFKWFIDLLALFAERARQHFIWQPMNRESLRDLAWLKEPVRQFIGNRMPRPLQEVDFLRGITIRRHLSKSDSFTGRARRAVCNVQSLL